MEVNQETFRHAPETWSTAECERISKRVWKDGLGTPYPFPGYIPGPFGPQRSYNGPIERNGELWKAEYYPFPEIPSQFRIIAALSWGYRLVELARVTPCDFTASFNAVTPWKLKELKTIGFEIVGILPKFTCMRDIRKVFQNAGISSTDEFNRGRSFLLHDDRVAVCMQPG